MASIIARQILSDMWEYGRILLIVVIAMAGWGVVLGRLEGEDDRVTTPSGLILIGLGIVGSFVTLSFLNVQASNIVALVKVKPVWGALTCLVALLVITIGWLISYRKIRQGRLEAALSLAASSSESKQVLFTRAVKVSCSVLLLLAIIDIAWLWKLSH